LDAARHLFLRRLVHFPLLWGRLIFPLLQLDEASEERGGGRWSICIPEGRRVSKRERGRRKCFLERGAGGKYLF